MPNRTTAQQAELSTSNLAYLQLSIDTNQSVNNNGTGSKTPKIYSKYLHKAVCMYIRVNTYHIYDNPMHVS